MARATRRYAKQNPQIGEAFADALDTAIARVAENPYLYAIVRRKSRWAPVPGFQHGVLYRIEEDCIVVIACTHSRRHPRHWRTD